jgi:hypothetical protein
VIVVVVVVVLPTVIGLALVYVNESSHHHAFTDISRQERFGCFPYYRRLNPSLTRRRITSIISISPKEASSTYSTTRNMMLSSSGTNINEEENDDGALPTSLPPQSSSSSLMPPVRTSPSSSSSSILVVGLNAALQKRFVLAEKDVLQPGKVHRSPTIMQEGIGGKGQDVAVALSCLCGNGNTGTGSGKSAGTGANSKEAKGRGEPLSSSSSPESLFQLAQFVGRGVEGDTVLRILEQYYYDTEDNNNNASASSSPSLSHTSDCNVVEEQQNATSSCGGGTRSFLTIRTNAKLRTCTTIVASDMSTELVEPSGVVSSDELEMLLTRIRIQHQLYYNTKLNNTEVNDTYAGAYAYDHKKQAIVIMGSMPPGCPEDTYAKIVQQCCGGGCGSDSNNNRNTDTSHQSETLLLVDSVIGLTPVLDTVASMSRNMNMVENGPPPPTMMLKINVDELIKLAGSGPGPGPGLVPRDSSGGAESTPRSEEVKNAVQAFLTQTASNAAASVRYLALTDGKDAAYFADIHHHNNSMMRQQHEHDDKRRIHKVDVNADVYMLHPPDLSSSGPPPPTPTLLYPIGAGDAASAGTIAAWMFLTSSSEQQQQKEASTDRCCGGDIQQHLNSKVQETLRLGVPCSGCRRDEHTSQVMPPDLALRKDEDEDGHENENENAITTAHSSFPPALCAFQFGLACASASCLLEENSMLDPEVAVRLYQSLGAPKHIGTLTIN